MKYNTVEQCEARINDIEIELRWRSVICGQILAIRELNKETKELKQRIRDIKNAEIKKQKELEQEINRDMNKLKKLITEATINEKI